MLTLANDVIQQEETVRLANELDVHFGERVDPMVGTQEPLESWLQQRMRAVGELRTVTGTARHTAERVEVQHLGINTKPVVIPTAEQPETTIGSRLHTEVAEVPIDEHRYALQFVVAQLIEAVEEQPRMSFHHRQLAWRQMQRLRSFGIAGHVEDVDGIHLDGR